jgi:type IV pilus assembly protein PilB
MTPFTSPPAASEDAVLTLLVDTGQLLPGQVASAAARRDSEAPDSSVVYFLIADGTLPAAAALNALGALHDGLRTVDLSSVDPSPDSLALIGAEHVRRLGALPFSRGADHSVHVAFADPYPLTAVEELERILVRVPVQAFLTDSHSLRTAIDRFYPASASVREISIVAEERPAESAPVDADASQSVVPRAVTEILTDGVRLGASDIHIEFYGSSGRVRYRIDGAMIERPESLRERFQQRIVGRIKYLARMDQGQSRVPDNGSIATMIDGRTVQFRVSTLPTVHGEKVVLRILENSDLALDLEELGLAPDDLRSVREAAARRDRMLLVTGPTGSGKSTLIYALLAELNRRDCNIVTIEDPVERRIQGINQVNIQGRGDEDAPTRLTFARVLNDVLRQDPDILMVGEIRDRATAETATRAAITGHSVLSTLHTTDTVSTIARLRGLGIPDYAIVDTVALVVAQRLVRKICPQCTAPDSTPLESVLLQAGLPQAAPRSFRRGRGCTRCNHTGFAGRTAIHELLPMSGALRQAVIAGRSPDELREVARAEGQVSLRRRALVLAAEGRTTFEEAVYETPAPE